MVKRKHLGGGLQGLEVGSPTKSNKKCFSLFYFIFLVSRKLLRKVKWQLQGKEKVFKGRRGGEGGEGLFERGASFRNKFTLILV